VGEQHRDSDVPLAVRVELGPVVGHGLVVVELAAVDQHRAAKRGYALRSRPDVGERVVPPGHRASAIGVARPEVDECAALAGHRERRPNFTTLKILLERDTEGLETGFRVPMDFDAGCVGLARHQ